MTRTGKTLLFCFLAVALAFGLGACKKTNGTVKEVMDAFGGTFEADPDFTKNPPKTVAVLPFVDESGSGKGSDTVRRGFYNHFSSLPFQDMEMDRIDQVLVVNDLADPKVAYDADPKELGRLLGVDAVVRGRVSNFDKLFVVLYSNVSVGANVEMYDTRTGKRLWMGEDKQTYHEGGFSLSPVGLVATVVSTSLNMRDIQLLRACDDLFRDMVKTIPIPKKFQSSTPPAITLMVQDTKNEPKKAGDRIQIVIQGDPGQTAWVDIAGFKDKITAREVEPGVYLAEYTVVPGDNVAEAVVIGYLSDKAGNKSTWIDPVGTITLDTTPPAVPAGLSVLGKDGLAEIKWDKNTEADLAGYRVLMSKTPLSGFQLLEQTEFNKATATGLTNYEALYFQVSALDRAGNLSKPCQAVEGMAVAPGPTRVSGALDGQVTWYAGSSPYILTGPVMVMETAHLTIEPGAQIQSQGEALTIKGRLTAMGTRADLIRFGSSQGQSWAGIVFENTGERQNTLGRAIISGANVGVTCVSASPAVTGCELDKNTVGIQAQGALSKPRVVNTAIKNSQDAGLSVLEGAAPLVTGCVITGSRAGGVTITQGSPRITGNTIFANQGGGVVADSGQPVVEQNNIFDNQPQDISGPDEGAPVQAPANWWGSAAGQDVMARFSGRVAVESVLDAPYPNGKAVPILTLDSALSGSIATDAFVLAAKSPFTVTGKLTLENGVTLFVQPGAVIQYNAGASIVVNGGGITAQGTKEDPIRFTSAGASPAPGDYASAVRFTRDSGIASFFKHCVVEYAATGINVEAGAPEIAYCHVRHNSQSGVRAVGEAAPKVSYSTISHNQGSGGLEVRGYANPKIHGCNITDNAVGIQAFSTIQTSATNNWWGISPPDYSVIWGDTIDYVPFLEAPSEKAWALEGK